MNVRKEDLLLYAIAGRSQHNSMSVAEQAEAALRGGVTFLQLREKTLDHDEFLKEAVEIRALCAKYGVPFVINDDVQIALEAEADGVHVGQSDMACAEARKLLGPDKIIGVSAKTPDQARLAEEQGADYLGVGAVFATDSKGDATTISYEQLLATTGAVNLPVVAIGGISAENISYLERSGVAGIAVISAIFSAPDIEKEARELKKKAKDMVEK